MTELNELKALLEKEQQKRQEAESDLQEVNKKLNASMDFIKEAVGQYEKVYRKLIALETNSDFNEKNLSDELELMNNVLDSLKLENNTLDESLEYCYNKLEKVSRSFTIVINQLNPLIKDEICVFYLVLRALDTIEDDPKIDTETKISFLKNFYKNIGNENYRHENIGDHPDYVELMQNYTHVAKVYNRLDPKFQTIITEITIKMADGMIEFVNAKRIKTIEEYDKYCHYVAGLVGIGLTKIFVTSGIEDEDLLKKIDFANSMGLFLQKTNITRDYAEDVEQKRYFWPDEICPNFGSDYIEYLNKPNQLALDMLNCMVNDALRHFKECVNFLKSLKEQSVFKFCAIPQIMALATLELVYNNELVFSKNVKIEKSESLKIFSNCSNISQFYTLVREILVKWTLKLEKNDGVIFHDTKVILNEILENDF